HRCLSCASSSSPALIHTLFSADPSSSRTSTLSLHDALPIYSRRTGIGGSGSHVHHVFHTVDTFFQRHDDAVHHRIGIMPLEESIDRKSTRLNSSHVSISYAVFCLKKKNIDNHGPAVGRHCIH